LSGVTRLSGAQLIGERELSEPAYIHAMLEQTAETLDKLQRNVMRDDAQRHLVGDQVLNLGRELAAFVDLSREQQRVLSLLAKRQGELVPVLEDLVDTRSDIDVSMHEHVKALSTNINKLTEELEIGREYMAEEIRDELRLIGRAISTETHERSRLHKKKAG